MNVRMKTKVLRWNWKDNYTFFFT